MPLYSCGFPFRKFWRRLLAQAKNRIRTTQCSEKCVFMILRLYRSGYSLSKSNHCGFPICVRHESNRNHHIDNMCHLSRVLPFSSLQVLLYRNYLPIRHRHNHEKFRDSVLLIESENHFLQVLSVMKTKVEYSEYPCRLSSVQNKLFGTTAIVSTN